MYGSSTCRAGGRVERSTVPNGQVRVLTTSLSTEYSLGAPFGMLYRRRWRIRESLQAIEVASQTEGVSSTSQHAVLVDMAA